MNDKERQPKIFINCPYDDEYKPLFFAMIYICEYFGYTPIFAASDESSSDRMDNIVKCIQESNYAIHDISKIHETIPRYNMPFELGMYYMHIKENGKKKRMLILEGESNKSDVVISDLSGTEIKCHSNELEELFKAIRSFLRQFNTNIKDSPQKLYIKYMLDYLVQLEFTVKANGFKNYLELSPSEFEEYVQDYCREKS